MGNLNLDSHHPIEFLHLLRSDLQLRHIALRMLARSSLRSTRAVGAVRNGAINTSKRAASSSSSAADSPFRLNVAGSVATAVAAGSVAWYYHLYGTELHAMTPAEEGLHATKYPWVQPDGPRHLIIKPSAVVSKSIKKSARPATPSAESHTDLWSELPTPSMRRRLWQRRTSTMTSLTTRVKSQSDPESSPTTSQAPTRTTKLPVLRTMVLFLRI